MGVFRFNQDGVASELTYGRKGGKIKWHTGTSVFAMTNNTGNAARLKIADELSIESFAATISDVDRRVQGIRTKSSARVIVTNNINLADPLIMYDGITLNENDRILVAGQTDKKQNGIYALSGLNVMSRTADATNYKLIEGAYVYITEGDANEGTSWVLNVLDDSDVNALADTFDIEIKQFSGEGTLKAGIGINITDNLVDFSLPKLIDFSGTAIYDNVVAISDGASSTKITLDKLFNDLGVDGWQIHDDNNSVSVAASRDVKRDAIVFSVKETLTHSADTQAVQVSADGFIVDYTQPAIGIGAIGSSVKLKAGIGNAARGGNVELTAGTANGVGMIGGDIILTPGASVSSADDGIVRINSANAMKIPVGVTAERPVVAEAGFIRINTDVIGGVDSFEFFDAQDSGGKWKSVGGGSNKLEDLDKDTYITVSDSPAGDEDTIKMHVGPTNGLYDAGFVFVASGEGITMSVPSATNKTTDNGGAVNISAGNGLKGGDVIISTGKGAADAFGPTKAGKVSVHGFGGIELLTNNAAAEAAGNIVIKAGDSTLLAGTVSIQPGAGTGSSVEIATLNAKTLTLGHVGAVDVTIDSGANVKVGTDSTVDIEIGDRAVTTTKLHGKTVFIGGAPDATGSINMVAGEIHIGDDISTTSISIGNTGADSTDISIEGNDIVIESDTSLVLKANTSGMNVKVSTTGIGVIEVENPNYTAAVTSANHIPNLEFVMNAVRDATLGGVGRRTFQIPDFNAATGTVFSVLDVLPTNARITKVVVEVVTPIVTAATTSMSINAASGSTILATNNDIDLYSKGTYIVEYSGVLTSGGQVTLNFDVDLSGATAGNVFVSIEFGI